MAHLSVREQLTRSTIAIALPKGRQVNNILAPGGDSILNELALFAGGGGGLLGTKLLGFRPVCYVENEPYCIEILKARIRDGFLDDAPIWDDARTFDGRPWRGVVDIITAGFPCQPFSIAGRRLGEADPRNLWPDTLRIISEVAPSLILLENVAKILIDTYIGYIFGSLAESGYDYRWDCIPASAIGANHERDRIWILAYSIERGREKFSPADKRKMARPHEEEDADGPDPGSGRLPLWQGLFPCGKEANSATSAPDWWLHEPGMDRVVDGLAHRVDRIRALGEGQVPAVVKAFWKLTTGEAC